MSSGRTAMYSPEGIFSLEITHPSRPAAKLNKKYSALDGVTRYNFRTSAHHKATRMPISTNRKKADPSLSGRPYPNIVHNVQSPALKQTRLPYIKISRICRHSDMYPLYWTISKGDFLCAIPMNSKNIALTCIGKGNIRKHLKAFPKGVFA